MFWGDENTVSLSAETGCSNMQKHQSLTYFKKLTQSEIEMLKHLEKGMTTREIANAMHIKCKEVKLRLKHITAKVFMNALMLLLINI
jgi:DNA-binding NarL/FixJ family response regulator